MVDRIVDNCGKATFRERYSDFEVTRQAIVLVSPFPIYPLERYYQKEAFLRFEGTTSGNKQVAPALHTVLDGRMFISCYLVAIKIDV